MPDPSLNHDKYIVVFKDHITAEQVDQYANDVSSNGGKVFNRYDGIMNGFSATIPDNFLSALQSSDLVDYIERDSTVTTQ